MIISRICLRQKQRAGEPKAEKYAVFKGYGGALDLPRSDKEKRAVLVEKPLWPHRNVPGYIWRSVCETLKHPFLRKHSRDFGPSILVS